MGLGFCGFSESLLRLSPDIVVLLGDRFEIFSLRALKEIVDQIQPFPQL